MTEPLTGFSRINFPDGAPAECLRHKMRTHLGAGTPFEIAWAEAVAYAADGELAWVRAFAETADYWRRKYEES